MAEHSSTDQAIALIGELPADQAEAVMLRIGAGMDVARVATIMGRTPGSVRVLCHRGLRCLEQRLAAAALEDADLVGASKSAPRISGATVRAVEGQRILA